MRVLLYGRIAEAIDRRVELVDAPDGCSVAELRRRLAGDYPAAAATLARSRAIIGSTVVGDDHVLSAGDDVEFLPPVSGG